MKRESRGPKLIAEILKDVLKGEELNQALTLKDISESWSGIVGTRIAEISKIKDFSGGKLYISVISSVWKMELSYKKADILKKIHSCYDKKSVKEIIFL